MSWPPTISMKACPQDYCHSGPGQINQDRVGVPALTGMKRGRGPGSAATGELFFSLVDGSTVATRLLYGYPLRMMYIPKCVTDHNIDCPWVYLLSYGGGLLGGDTLEMTCKVGEKCTAVLTTQGSTKVYKMPREPRGGPSSSSSIALEDGTFQSMHATIGPQALLCLLPEPYTCFRGSKYSQIQDVDVSSTGNLVLVDWYTSGRMGRGESWAFARMASVIQIRVDGRLVVYDPLLLEDGSSWEAVSTPSTPPSSVAERMRGYECMCLVVVMGPTRLQPLLGHIAAMEGKRVRWPGRLQQQQEVASTTRSAAKESSSSPTTACMPNGVHRHHAASHQQQQPPPPQPGQCISSFCRLGADMMVVKAAAKTTEAMREYLRDLLRPLNPLIGTVPYK